MGYVYSIYYILFIRRWQDWGLPSTAPVVANLRVLFVWQHDPDRCFGSGNQIIKLFGGWSAIINYTADFWRCCFQILFHSDLVSALELSTRTGIANASCRQLKKQDIIWDTQILRSSIAKNALNITGIDMNAMYIYNIWLYFHYLFTLDLH